jgi:hypothetical protein
VAFTNARAAPREQTAVVRLTRIVLVAAALGALYSRFVREQILSWGASEDEAAARLPGD